MLKKEEILAMEAGLALDALVESEIFNNSAIIAKEYQCVFILKEGRGYPAPTYSTDISAAWQVFEKTDFDVIWRLLGIPAGKSQYCIGYARGEMSELVCYTRDKNPENCLSPICSSFPEAACKAALIAKFSSR